MSDADKDLHLEALIAAAPDLVGLSVDAGARDAVRANLDMALRSAAQISDFGYEAGPVFRA
ncbi:MAG: hypothetical protein AAFV62_05570 [Pseudomonadota bacterium]